VKIYDYNGQKNISGSRIRELRLKRRLSQEELAAKMQVEGIELEQNAISRLEMGQRFIPDYELPIFAKVLGTSVDWLLGLTDE